MDFTLDIFINKTQDAIAMPIEYLFNSKKRICYLYLLSSLILSFWVYFKGNKKVSFLKYVFAKKIWLSDSAFVDYGFIFFNSFIKIFLLAPFLIFGLSMALSIDEFMFNHLGESSINLGPIQTLVFYTIILTLINDFSAYLVHLLMHKVSFLWAFHKVHHSATTLNPVTQYRIHPVELIINNFRILLIMSFVSGVFLYMTSYPINYITFFGVNILSFIFLIYGSNLRHSHVKLSYFNWIESLIISPFQHQIHHSNNPAHYNKNMGSKLAIWDWMFGTLIKSNKVDKIKFGLGEKEDKNHKTFIQNLLNPFFNIIHFKK